MKYTRLEISNKFTNSKHNTLFWFFIILPLISIVFGGLSTKFFITPYFKNQSIKASAPKVIKDISLIKTAQIKPVSQLYFLQVGVFSNKDNAQALKKAITENGFSPFVVHNKGMYKVIVSFSENKNNLLDNRDKLNLQGYSSIVVDVKDLAIVMSKKNESIVINDYFKSINNLFAIQLDLIKQTTPDGSINKLTFDAEINNFAESYKALNNQIDNKELMDTLSEYNSELKGRYDEFKRCIESKKGEDLNRIVLEQAFLLENLSQKLNNR